MTRKSTDIDEFYKTTISQLPAPDRISYCNQQLDKIQYILEKNRELLTSEQKAVFKEMIEALQQELKMIKT